MSWDWTDETREQLAQELARYGLGDGSTAPRIRPIGEGHSNLTYRVEAGGRSFVLRRPPPPPLPTGSNDLLREARIQSALGATDLPVARIIGTGDEGVLFDVPFYIMSLIDGDVITETMPARFDNPARRREVGLELVGVLAALHQIDWRGIGLESLGKPDGFNARHVRRIGGLLSDAERAENADFTILQAWLEEYCPPESSTALIHNDCRIGNVMWAFGDVPRIAAVLDWELATIGDPLLDLAYTLSSLPREGVCRQPVQDLAAACLGEGFPAHAELIAHYAQLTGREPVHFGWYAAMVNWKLAILYGYSRRKGMDSYYCDDSHALRFLAEAKHHAAMVD